MNRKIGLDIVRLIATLEVICLHASSNSLIKLMCSNCVLLFVMISGAIHLNEDYVFDYSKMVRKILRITISFVICSILYALLFDDTSSIRTILRNIFTGHYHLWFLYMIVGLYLVTPIIKYIIKDKRIYCYFFVLSFLTAVVGTTISDFSCLEAISYVIGLLNIHIGLGYVFVYILGRELASMDFCIKERILVYIAGLISLLFVSKFSFNDTNLFRVIYAVAAFVFLLEVGSKVTNERMIAFIEKLSDKCFVAYLVHVAVIYIVSNLSSCYGAMGEMIRTIIVIVVSFLSASVIRVLFNIVRTKYNCIVKR